MFRTLVRWTLRIGFVAAVAAVAAGLRAPKTGTPGADALVPAIGGDTWPPVPVAPDRAG